MKDVVREAIESARTVGRRYLGIAHGVPQRRHSFQNVRAIVYAVVQELPPEMTMSELCDELNIASAQIVIEDESGNGYHLTLKEKSNDE